MAHLTRDPPLYEKEESSDRDYSFVTWQQEVLSDGSLVCGLRLVRSCGEEEWQTCMTELKRLIRWIRTHRVCCQFLLEVDPRGGVTMEQVVTLRAFLGRKRVTLLENLKGTIVLLHSPAVKMIILAAIAVTGPPVKPFETIVVDPKDGAARDKFGMTADVRERVMSHFLSLPWPDAPSSEGGGAGSDA